MPTFTILSGRKRYFLPFADFYTLPVFCDYIMETDGGCYNFTDLQIKTSRWIEKSPVELIYLPR